MTFRQTMYLDVTVTVGKPLGGGAPLELSNTKAIVLLNDKLTKFLPWGDIYQLQQPVDLAPVDSPTRTVGQLQPFSVTIAHAP